MANPRLKLYLGIDFGTSLTKVCVRGSDIPRRSEIVTFAGFNLNQAMLPTQVGISAEGRLTDVMTKAEWEEHSSKDLSIIDYIKMRLSKLDHEHESFPAASLPTVQKVDLNQPEAIENLCGYYLSGVIRRAQAWFVSKYLERCAGMELEWHVQLGVPVKHCDSPALARFQKVLQMAWLLTQASILTTVHQLMDVMTELRQNPLANSEPFCSVKAEIAAAVRSYTEQPTAQQGLKFFFDVGSGTIE